MNKANILVIVTILIGMSGTSVARWNTNREIHLSDTTQTEYSATIAAQKVPSQSYSDTSEELSKLNSQIEADIVSYIHQSSSLTNLKKAFKKNLQARKKTHKVLLEKYNENFSEDYLVSMRENALQIEKVQTMKNLFFEHA